MTQLNLKHYKINTIEKDELLKRGFTGPSKGFYRMSFPCYSWHKNPVLFCKLIVDDENGDVHIDVIDGNNVSYPPFYDDTFSSFNLVVKFATQNILKKFNELGIKEKKEKKNYDDQHRRLRQRL